MENIHKEIYSNLESIIQKLDTRLNLKLFAIYYDKSDQRNKACRVIRILNNHLEDKTRIIAEPLQTPEAVFSKLGLSGGDWRTELEVLQENPFFFDFKPFLNQHQSYTESIAADSVASQQLSSSNDLFYSAKFIIDNPEQLEVSYIFSLNYADSETRFLFDEKPQLSFLRMVLDYYFLDYYECDPSSSNHRVIDGNLIKKHREDSGQYLQRITRLFVGKLENLIFSGTQLDVLSEQLLHSQHILDPQYYINTLLEKIDGISTRTYEGESPFGCMLLMNKMETQNEKLISYIIQFQGQDNRILFDDARKIRKLLKLTNIESDLYLIADHEAVYGIGKVDWSEVSDSLLIKVEFKGLGRYDVQLLSVDEKKGSESHIVTSRQKKIHKQTMNYEISTYVLISVSFKRPGATDGGFTAERFRNILKSEFDKPDLPLSEEAIDKLQLTVQKAKEQQTGTMVVITEKYTAEREISILRKQSTLIKPTEISPEVIQYFTSIDGALYLDTSGSCHAIGVILDGLAQEDSGDSSRGARYHSAYRYMDKLHKDPNQSQKCVIAIISEDGTVDIIPKPANETYVQQLVTDYVGYIQDSSELDNEKLNEYDRQLELISETFIDHYHYFILGDAFFKKEHYNQAANYYSRGLKLSGQFNITYNRSHALSTIRNTFKIETPNKTNLYLEVLDLYNTLIQSSDSSDLVANDFNCRGLTLHNLGALSKDQQRQSYLERALQDFNKALNIKASSIIFANRAALLQWLERYTEALDDLIRAELNHPQDSQLESIMRIVGKELPFYIHAVTYYNSIPTKSSSKSKLSKALKEYGESLNIDNEEVAAALQEMN